MSGNRGDFDEWMSRVDAQLEMRAGVAADDLPDQEWHEWWEDGMRPPMAAITALAESGWEQ